jgi:hypothetical protein
VGGLDKCRGDCGDALAIVADRKKIKKCFEIP